MLSSSNLHATDLATLVVRAGPALFYLAGELSKSGECDAQRGIEVTVRSIAATPVRMRYTSLDD